VKKNVRPYRCRLDPIKLPHHQNGPGQSPNQKNCAEQHKDWGIGSSPIEPTIDTIWQWMIFGEQRGHDCTLIWKKKKPHWWESLTAVQFRGVFVRAGSWKCQEFVKRLTSVFSMLENKSTEI
jgi:hypothetical protein